MSNRRIFVFLLLLFISSISFAQQPKSLHFAQNSVLASGNWYKLATTADGVYKLTYADLLAAGATPPFKSGDFRLYGNGGGMLPEKNAGFRFDDLIENKVMVEDGGDGYIDANDYILFYGSGTSVWNYNQSLHCFSHQINYYADSSYYFFTFDKGAGHRISEYPIIASLPEITVKSYNDLFFHETDSLNLLNSGKEWVGEEFDDVSAKNFNYSFSDFSDTSNLTANICLWVHSTLQSAFQININGTITPDTILPVDGSMNSEYVKINTAKVNFIPHSDTINICLTFNKPDIGSIAWLDYIELQSVRKLVYRQKQIKFRNIQTIGHEVSQFSFDNLGNQFKIWHIGDSGNISEMHLDINGNTSSFKANTNSLSEFIAFDENNAYHPDIVGPVPNQNLHGFPQSELIIVTHPLFLSNANELADFHRNNDLMTFVVATTQQIYNEFSSGKQDPSAIRDFVRMFYERGGADTLNRVHYLLLFGDGSYDMKNRIPNNTDMIPTWQTENSILPISSYVSDDFFGMLDSIEGDNLNGNLDVGVGRFPVSTTTDAGILVAKSIRYGQKNDELEYSYENGLISNYDSWRNNISFVADDEDGNLHLNQTENMVTLLDSLTNKLSLNKIYLDAYKQIHTPLGNKYPDANIDLDNNIRNGSLFINYVGHGGEYGLADEGVLTFSEIGKYSNFYCLPVFVTATCEFSRYDNPELTSAGEKILLNANGGGIAMFTTTRVAFAHSNEIVNRNLLKTTFSDDQNDKVRFGDIIKASKNLCGFGVYKENFTLLGDPALSLAIPEYEVRTEKILSDTTNITDDTIFNSKIITVKGFISDKNGNKLDWFDGKIYPKVFDKPIIIHTLANDPGQSYVTAFNLQQSILFNGNSTVKGGEFQFSFFAPRDITFGNGFGKIIYYAKSPFFDAHGIADSLLIINDGNISNSDNSGPDINIFMENLSFMDGGETSADPLMIAFLKDTSGINCTGLGIGHDIVGEIDDNFNEPVFLNKYFIQDADKYTSGMISYKFTGLSYGIHTMTLTAWDFLDNKGEKKIIFNVKSPTDVDLGGIYNYPDPVDDHTTFFIERNMSTDVMSVKISITDVTGKVCVELNQIVPPGSYKPIEIYWNGKNAMGASLAKGFYTYTVSLSDVNGKLRQKSDKMVVIR
jgi:hypothetical protein